MFNIKNDKAIQINKGDTAQTVLYVNQGTKMNPIRYNFDGTYSITNSASLDDYEIVFDYGAWKNKISEAGTYVFTFSNMEWLLDNIVVELVEYGLSLPHALLENIPEGSTITVIYTLNDNMSEVYFYVWQINQKMGQTPVIEKVIKPYINQVVTKVNGTIISTEERNCTNENGDVVIYFNPDDTNNIPQGEYRYQIIAKVLQQGVYTTNTICNRKPFIVVEDDYSNRVW